ADLLSAVLALPRERDNCLIWTLYFLQVLTNGLKIVDRSLHAPGDHHGPSFTADKLTIDDLFVEVIHHDLRLQPYRVSMALDVVAQLLLGALRVVFRIIRNRLHELVITVDGRVVLEDVLDEALINRLFHRVGMERSEFLLTPVHVWRAEDL